MVSRNCWVGSATLVSTHLDCWPLCFDHSRTAGYVQLESDNEGGDWRRKRAQVPLGGAATGPLNSKLSLSHVVKFQGRI